jgi:hypothetical protein
MPNFPFNRLCGGSGAHQTRVPERRAEYREDVAVGKGDLARKSKTRNPNVVEPTPKQNSSTRDEH